MAKSRRLRNSRNSKSRRRRGGNKCGMCSVCNVQMKYYYNGGGDPYCQCPKCARSYYTESVRR